MLYHTIKDIKQYMKKLQIHNKFIINLHSWSCCNWCFVQHVRRKTVFSTSSC